MDGTSSMNLAEELRQAYNCEAMKQCVVCAPNPAARVFHFTVCLQKVLTMVHTDEDGFATALSMFTIGGSPLYLPFRYKHFDVELQ